MRVYKEKEKVRLPDDSIATVVEVHQEPYELPKGQMIGAGQTDLEMPVKGGHAWYKVKRPDGKIVTVKDRDVRNPPKKG
jgi:hypothetical protein